MNPTIQTVEIKEINSSKYNYDSTYADCFSIGKLSEIVNIVTSPNDPSKNFNLLIQSLPCPFFKEFFYKKIPWLSPEYVIDTCFDIKSRGDLSQLEFFLANKDTVYSFETIDTFLLLIAIIKIGNDDNLQDRNRFIMFNTIQKKVPIIYKLSFFDISGIYMEMCNTIFKTDIARNSSFLSNYEAIIHKCFIKTARLFDTFHDFGTNHTHTQEYTIDENIPLITFIDNFKDYSSNIEEPVKPAKSAPAPAQPAQPTQSTTTVIDFFDNVTNTEITKKFEETYEEFKPFNIIYDCKNIVIHNFLGIDINSVLEPPKQIPRVPLFNQPAQLAQSSSAQSAESAESSSAQRRGNRPRKVTNQRREEQVEQNKQKIADTTRKQQITLYLNQFRHNNFIPLEEIFALSKIINTSDCLLSTILLKENISQFTKLIEFLKKIFKLDELDHTTSEQKTIGNEIIKKLKEMKNKIFNEDIIASIKTQTFETYLKIPENNKYCTDTQTPFKDIQNLVLMQEISITFSVLLHIEFNKNNISFIRLTPTIDFIYNNIKGTTTAGQEIKLTIHYDINNLTKTLYNEYQQKSTVQFFTDFSELFKSSSQSKSEDKFKKQLRIFGYITDYNSTSTSYGGQQTPLIVGINDNIIFKYEFSDPDCTMMIPNDLKEGLFSYKSNKSKKSKSKSYGSYAFLKEISKYNFQIYINDSQNIELNNLLQTLKKGNRDLASTFNWNLVHNAKNNVFNSSYGLYIIPQHKEQYEFLSCIVDVLYNSRFYCSKIKPTYREAKPTSDSNNTSYKIYTGYNYDVEGGRKPSTFRPNIYTLCLKTHYPIFYRSFNYYDFDNGIQLQTDSSKCEYKINEFCFQNKLNCNFLINPSEMSSKIYKQLISNFGILEICNFVYEEILNVVFEVFAKKFNTTKDTNCTIAIFELSLITRCFISLHIKFFIEYIYSKKSDEVDKTKTQKIKDFVETLITNCIANNELSYTSTISQLHTLLDLSSTNKPIADFNELMIELFKINKSHSFYSNFSDTEFLDIGFNFWSNLISKHLQLTKDIFENTSISDTSMLDPSSDPSSNTSMSDHSSDPLSDPLSDTSMSDSLSDTSISDPLSGLFDTFKNKVVDNILKTEIPPYFPLWLNFYSLIDLLKKKKILSDNDPTKTNCSLYISDINPYESPHIKFIEIIFPYLLKSSITSISSLKADYYSEYNDINFETILKAVINRLLANFNLKIDDQEHKKELSQKKTYVTFLDGQKLEIEALTSSINQNQNILKDLVKQHIKRIIEHIDNTNNDEIYCFTKIFHYFTRSKGVGKHFTNFGEVLIENPSLEETIRKIIISFILKKTDPPKRFLPDKTRFTAYKKTKGGTDNFDEVCINVNAKGNFYLGYSESNIGNLKLMLDATNIAKELRNDKDIKRFGENVASLFDPSVSSFKSKEHTPIFSFKSDIFKYGNDYTMISKIKLELTSTQNPKKLNTLKLVFTPYKNSSGGKYDKKYKKKKMYGGVIYEQYFIIIFTKILLERYNELIRMKNLGYIIQKENISENFQEIKAEIMQDAEERIGQETLGDMETEEEEKIGQEDEIMQEEVEEERIRQEEKKRQEKKRQEKKRQEKKRQEKEKKRQEKEKKRQEEERKKREALEEKKRQEEERIRQQEKKRQEKERIRQQEKEKIRQEEERKKREALEEKKRQEEKIRQQEKERQEKERIRQQMERQQMEQRGTTRIQNSEYTLSPNRKTSLRLIQFKEPLQHIQDTNKIHNTGKRDNGTRTPSTDDIKPTSSNRVKVFGGNIKTFNIKIEKNQLILQKFSEKLLDIKQQIKDTKDKIKTNPNNKSKYLSKIDKFTEKFNQVYQQKKLIKSQQKLQLQNYQQQLKLKESISKIKQQIKDTKDKIKIDPNNKSKYLTKINKLTDKLNQF